MENLRGALLMVLAMAAFAVEDTLIKFIAGSLPLWQILLVLSVGGGAVFGVMTRRQGKRLLPPESFSRPIIFRNLAEMVGTFGYVTAITLTPLSQASAILQATPLVVTLGAAVMLGEHVGWRRWSTIFIGFFGVLLILRPTSEGFDLNVIYTLIGVLGLAVRDLATRRAPASMSSPQLGFQGFVMLIPVALFMALSGGQGAVWPELYQIAILASGVVIGVMAYYAIVAAMRVGDVSYVTPFRYSRILFGLIAGMVFFGERPDFWMLVGSAIVVLSGIYLILRERKLRDSG